MLVLCIQIRLEILDKTSEMITYNQVRYTEQWILILIQIVQSMQGSLICSKNKDF